MSAGGMRRLSLFMRAIGRIADEIDMLFLVSQQYIDDSPDLAALSRQQSVLWQKDIQVSLAPLERRRETFLNHYVLSALSIRHHPFFHAYSGPRQVAAVAERLKRNPDFVFVQRMAAMCPIQLIEGALPPIFFDLDDVEHRAKLRAALAPPHRPGKYAYMAQSPAIHLAERRAARHARAVFVCSEQDRRYLTRLGVNRLHVVPNAVALPNKQYRAVADQTVMFLGNFGHPPNIGAIERLIRRIWPIIRVSLPDATLLIAGAGSQTLACSGTLPEGVRILGFVDDLAALYAASRVICCPLLEGGGTRVKIIEAAAYGRPVVSSRIGAEGLDLRNGTEIVLAESDAAIAQACIALLTDAQYCRTIGMAAQEKIHALYDPQPIADAVADLLRRSLPARTPAGCL